MSETESKPETAPQQETGGDCSSASCCVSSETPETAALVRACLDDPVVTETIMAVKLTLKCKELELQRNALVKTLERIIEDMDGSGDEIGAKQLRAHVREILSHNV